MFERSWITHSRAEVAIEILPPFYPLILICLNLLPLIMHLFTGRSASWVYKGVVQFRKRYL